mmetsp:Transcript_86485/g.277623  ORF Transcript_86485/g.277623 Transcript_86485/m.277623 type:complete len:228 (-) Transcript_86485:567-1250(-)
MCCGCAREQKGQIDRQCGQPRSEARLVLHRVNTQSLTTNREVRRHQHASKADRGGQPGEPPEAANVQGLGNWVVASQGELRAATLRDTLAQRLEEPGLRGQLRPQRHAIEPIDAHATRYPPSRVRVTARFSRANFQAGQRPREKRGSGSSRCNQHFPPPAGEVQPRLRAASGKLPSARVKSGRPKYGHHVSQPKRCVKQSGTGEREGVQVVGRANDIAAIQRFELTS